MITIALERAIDERSIIGRQPEEDKSYDGLLAKLEQMLSGGSKPVVQPRRVAPAPAPVTTPIIQEEEDDSDLEMNFLLDIMK